MGSKSNKKRFSAVEKKMYWVGVGAAIGLSGDTRNFRENLKTTAMSESFKKGFGREASLNPPSARFDRRHDLPKASYNGLRKK